MPGSGSPLLVHSRLVRLRTCMTREYVPPIKSSLIVHAVQTKCPNLVQKKNLPAPSNYAPLRVISASVHALSTIPNKYKKAEFVMVV